MAATRTYAGASAETRRARRRAALVNTALALMASDGSAAVTVRAVCARAGLNQRYLYESFSGPEELLVAAFDVARLEAAQAMRDAAAAAGDDDATRARAAVARFVGMVADEPWHGRVLLFEAGTAPSLQPHRQRMLLAAARQFAREANDDELVVAGLMVAGAAHELLLAWTTGAVALSRDEVIDRIARSVVAIVAP